MHVPQSQNPLHVRCADNAQRFVAFAFAGADMVVETDAGGMVTYAAGAVHSKFGRPPEAFIDHAVRGHCHGNQLWPSIRRRARLAA
jgi:hypothetical protein